MSTALVLAVAAMQTNVGTNGFTGVMPDSSTPSRVTLYVDDVAVYRYR